VLGVALVLLGAAVLVYENFTTPPPLLVSGNNQGSQVNYLAFFGFAFGGAGFLILLFSFFQWFGKRRLK